MRTHCCRVLWGALLSLFLAMGPGIATVAAQADGTPVASPVAAGKVATYRAQVKGQASAFGPARGELVNTASTIARAEAGVNLYNFYATVRVTVPHDGAEHPWHIGLIFRGGREPGWRFSVTSDGLWEARIGGNIPAAAGAIDDLKTDPGQTNILEIAVDGDTAYVAVNRHELGAFDLSARRISGDVALIAWSSGGEGGATTTTPYSRFQIWELPGDGAIPPVDRDALGLLERGRDVADTDAPIGGPIAGALTGTRGDAVAVTRLGVAVADLYASAEVTAPRDGAQTPFDVGFLLRDTSGAEQFRLVFASDGTWYLRYGQATAFAAGRFTGFKTAAGATNLIEFAAVGDTLVFAVNGEAAGSADISAETEAGDLAIGAGFYGEQDVVAGDTTAFRAFTAWSLDRTATMAPNTSTPKTATPPPTATSLPTVKPPKTPTVANTEQPTEPPTEEPTIAPAETPAEVATETPATESTAAPTGVPTSVPAATDPAETFTAYLDAEPDLTTLFGPDAGDLTQEADSIAYVSANVNVTDFIAHAEFANPFDAADGGWDIGFFFRVGQTDPHYRLVIDSAGRWFLTPSDGDPIQQGEISNLKTRASQSNTIDLVVVGDTGYFGVNGKFVDQLDLSLVTQSGDVGVGTSFFQDNFKEGAVTSFKNFVVWEIDPNVIGGAPAATLTPEATRPPRPGQTAVPAAGARYTSETYGYTITYDDMWNIVDQSSENGLDYLRLSDGVSTVDFTGSESDFTPQACLDDEFGYFQSAEGYSGATPALDQEGAVLTGALGDGVFGVYAFTYTDEDGNATDYAAYVECQPLEPGVSTLQIVQFVAYDKYNEEIAARKALLAGVSLTGAPGSAPTATPTDEVTATSTPIELALAASIQEVDGSGVSAIASITFDGDQAAVLIFAFGAEDGTVATIQQGSCDDLPGKAAFKLQPIVGNASDSTITASFDELLNGGYVITLSEKGGSLSRPLACGELFS